MQSLLMENIHRSDLIWAFVICFSLAAFAAVMCWKGWGIDIHKHLEAEGHAYDEMHPEEKAEQERRAQAPPSL